MNRVKNKIVRAGAGAGKTSALIQAVIDSLLMYYEEKHHFPRVAISTFTRKATRELKERLLIKAMDLKDPALIRHICYSPRLQIATLHGLFYHFIQARAYGVGFGPGLSIISEQESLELWTSLLEEVLLERQIGASLLDHYSFEEVSLILKKYISLIPSGACTPVSEAEMHSLVRDKKNHVLESLKIKTTKAKEKELLDLQKEEERIEVGSFLCHELEKLGKNFLPVWKQKQQESNSVRLNDVENMTWAILEQKNQAFPKPLWDFWFLDEYQDTSLSQKNILDRLSQNSRVFIVGDPQQSIYLFRGAEANVFAQKEKELAQKPDSEVCYLNKNYRSCPELVAFFNDFFAEKKYQRMESSHEHGPVDPSRLPVRFIMAEKEKNSPPASSPLESELWATARHIEELMSQGVKPEDIAVLARQNKPLSRLAQYLNQSGSKNRPVPFQLYASGGFIMRREVLDALFVWNFLLNPHDDENLIGLLRTPYCRVPDSIIAERVREKQKLSLWSFWLELVEDKTGVSPIEEEVVRGLKDQLNKAGAFGLTEGFQQALESLGFMDLSDYQDPTGVGSANLWKLIYLLKRHEKQGSLFSFFDRLLEGDMGEDGESRLQNAVSALKSQGVQLMTIHSAKGLEFKHVIIIRVCSGFRGRRGFSYFVSERDTGNYALSVRSEEEDKRGETVFHKKVREKEREQELLEFDRLLYVAMTRAKESLTLVGSGKPEKDSWPRRFPCFAKLELGTKGTLSK